MTLDAGMGCFMEMTRTVNGSWGQLRINVPLEEDHMKLLVFDDDITYEE